MKVSGEVNKEIEKKEEMAEFEQWSVWIQCLCFCNSQIMKNRCIFVRLLELHGGAKQVYS